MFTTDEAVDVRTESLWDQRDESRWLHAANLAHGYTPPTWPASDVPKQLHLDLAVDDLGAAVAEARALGARLSDVQPAPGHWRVLIDPAGQPFGVTTLIPSEAQ